MRKMSWLSSFSQLRMYYDTIVLRIVELALFDKVGIDISRISKTSNFYSCQI